MSEHPTKYLGNLAETFAKFNLEKMGYIVYTTTNECTPIDLIGFHPTTNSLKRFQVKMRSDGALPTKNSWMSAKGVVQKPICTDYFDYFILVNSDITKLCYVPSDLIGITVRFNLPNSPTPFFWWEDFQLLEVKEHKKRSFREFGYGLTGENSGFSRRKCARPNRDELIALVHSMPITVIAKQYGVSDNAIRNWCKSDQIDCRKSSIQDSTR